jgi:putative CocE/NonD family hydrolase
MIETITPERSMNFMRLSATRARAILTAVALSAALAVNPSAIAVAQSASAARSDSSAFDEREVVIKMRDGVALYTRVFVPKNVSADLPIIFTRTPYGISNVGNTLKTSYAELAADGYIFAFQDIRGRFGSDGKFVMLRPMRDRKDPHAIDESTDAYDTIEWLIKNIPHNNKRVGMLGVSYPGWLTVVAMLDPHPALKAVSPQASPADMYLGDDFHHNGAFRLSYGFEYSALMERTKEQSPFDFGNPDSYDWYLKLGSLANINTKFRGADMPTWQNFVAHPNYDSFWQQQAVAPYLDRVKVPSLSVAGWWDQEDFYGPVKIYETLEPLDTKHLSYLVAGPWNHGAWNAPAGQKFRAIDFGSPTSMYFRKNIQAPWFAYWLKDQGTLKLSEATVFESGSNTWQSYDSWPPKRNVTHRKLYFGADHTLSFDAPRDKSSSAFDSFVSDPADPVPYRKRPITPTYSPGSDWATWLFSDQSFLHGRPDVMNYQTAPLTSDVVIAGDIAAHLFASTTGSDADWIVKIIDVYPEAASDSLRGYELMVANDVLRGRFRNSFVHPTAITPNKVESYTVDLHTQNYRFLKGHRILVQVQSSWFPLIDRNPQTFVPNIFEAKESDFKKATHKIYRSPGNASNVEVLMLNTPSASAH